MAEIEELLRKVELLRNHLEQLINEKKNLTDKEIVTASKILDAALNQYNEFIKEKISREP